MDFRQMASAVTLKRFEGIWLATKPAGAVVCAKLINGTLLMPYSLSEDRLTGHFFDCRLMDETLLCRFEQFDSAHSGALLLRSAPNETLNGGLWVIEQLPESVRKDISSLSESLPGMQPIVWIRVLRKRTPEWAEKYFGEDWPNKKTD